MLLLGRRNCLFHILLRGDIGTQALIVCLRNRNGIALLHYRGHSENSPPARFVHDDVGAKSSSSIESDGRYALHLCLLLLNGLGCVLYFLRNETKG